MVHSLPRSHSICRALSHRPCAPSIWKHFSVAGIEGRAEALPSAPCELLVGGQQGQDAEGSQGQVLKRSGGSEPQQKPPSLHPSVPSPARSISCTDPSGCTEGAVCIRDNYSCHCFFLVNLSFHQFTRQPQKLALGQNLASTVLPGDGIFLCGCFTVGTN